jgi:hypothetical protein
VGEGGGGERASADASDEDDGGSHGGCVGWSGQVRVVARGVEVAWVKIRKAAVVDC